MKRIECSAVNAGKFLDWIKNRGGVLLWESINLSNPGASWSSPALQQDGKPYSKPTWQCANEPALCVKSAEEVDVITGKLFKRVKIALRMGSQGLSIKLTDGSSEKVRKALDKAGEGSWYEFEDREALIFQPSDKITLAEWERRKAA